MAISSIGRTLSSNSLFSRYLDQKPATRKASSDSSSIGSLDSSSVSLVKSRLVLLAQKLEKFEETAVTRSQAVFQNETDGTVPDSEVASPEPGAGGEPGVPAPTSITFSIGDANKPVKFAKEINRAFKKGFESEDAKLLKRKVSGVVA